MIELQGIKKSYTTGAKPLQVLKGIDLNVKDGEFVSIMGSSGSGKSTLLNILGILDSYDEGNYTLAGTLIKDLSEKKAAQYRSLVAAASVYRSPALCVCSLSSSSSSPPTRFHCLSFFLSRPVRAVDLVEAGGRGVAVGRASTSSSNRSGETGS